MASGPEAESSSHDEGLTDLVRRIQAGDQTAIQSFRSMFRLASSSCFAASWKSQQSRLKLRAYCKRPFKRLRRLPRLRP
jgi:hypothetical protein